MHTNKMCILMLLGRMFYKTNEVWSVDVFVIYSISLLIYWVLVLSITERWGLNISYHNCGFMWTFFFFLAWGVFWNLLGGICFVLIKIHCFAFCSLFPLVLFLYLPYPAFLWIILNAFQYFSLMFLFRLWLYSF